MIAGNNHNLKSGILRRHSINKMIIQALRRSRRIGNIKNVSGYNQCINLPFTNFSGQPVQKDFMFTGTVIPEESLPQMPVGSM
jgi:hypothetical protein